VKGKSNAIYVRGSRNAVLEIDSSRLTDLPSKISDVIDQPSQALDAGASGVSSN